MEKLRVRPLHHKHKKKLRGWQRSCHSYVARYATILLQSDQGRSVQEIAQGLDLHVQTVRERVRTFNRAERHVCWHLLRPPQRSGRPLTYGPEVRTAVVDLLRQAPQQYGLDSAVWRLQDIVTVARRQGLLPAAAGAHFNVETVRRLLRQAGYVFLAAKWWINSPDPHYQHKKARRDRLVAWAQQDPSIMVVYQDESWFSGNPQAVGGYGRADQPQDAAAVAPSHKFKGAWVLYAAYEAVTHQVHRYYAPRCNQTQVRRHLEALLQQYQKARKRVLVVLWDNASWHRASWHRAQSLRTWVRQYNHQAKRRGRIRLLLIQLPSHSPWLNPLEPVFGQAKRHVLGRRVLAQAWLLKRKTEAYFNRRDTKLRRTAAKALLAT